MSGLLLVRCNLSLLIGYLSQPMIIKLPILLKISEKSTFPKDPKLALDRSYIIDTVLSVMKKFSVYESMILLQPTSPLRTSKDIDSVIKIGLQKNVQSVVSIAESIYAPQLFYSLSKNKTISPLIKIEKALTDKIFR